MAPNLSALVALLLAGFAMQGVFGVSSIRLRNSTLVIDSNATTPLPQDTAALAAVRLAAAQDSRGVLRRAYYASAYVDNQTNLLENGLNPLGSFSNVETANVYLRLSGTQSTYQALALQLVENNTLELTDNAAITLDRSSLRLNSQNWFYLTNASTLNLLNADMSLNNFFAWWADSSVVRVEVSLVSLTDMLTYWGDSELLFLNSTLNMAATSAPIPYLYTGQINPLFYATGSGVSVVGSTWNVRDMPLVHFRSGKLSVSNSTLTFNNTVVHMNAASLDFNFSEFVLNNCTLVLRGNTTSLTPVVAVQVTANATAETGSPSVDNATIATGQSLVGAPLGQRDVVFVNADVDLVF
ncbi:hypothetical protein V8C86DRAFT_2844947 [Haematococcus lacustris]